MGDGGQFFAIDREACNGHGRCYALAPESFVADDSGYGVPTGRDERDRSPEDVARIVGCCPEEAISVSPVAAEVSPR